MAKIEKEEPENEKPIVEKIDSEFPIDGDLNANCSLARTIIQNKDSIEYLISVEIILTKNENIQFHWGLFRYPQLNNWVAPPKSYYPKEETNPCDENSANTNFINGKIHLNLKILSTDKNLFHGITFVFHNLSNEK